ncbi:MAG: right-handed parallel beta-helix repeat-containing protein [Phycisphaerae bacterium]|nr:right-handed parallel beta-helix repeat-containing protein [Planctomycetia bacterium]MCL4719350.1 right-handed parallel beta-helix repeat-containing protein [Phycisphaerae bacterium]
MSRFIVALLSAQVALASERELHVANTGDDRNPGTELAPFKSIQRAADVAEAGDTVVIHAGLYARQSGRSRVLEVARTGTDDAPITFTSAGDGDVILDNQGGGDWVLYLNGRFNPLEHIIISGLTVQGGVSGGVYVRNTASAVVAHCRVVDNRGIGIYIGGGGANQVVRRCEAARNWIGIKAGNNLLTEQPTAVTIEENWSHHNVNESYPADSDGIQMLGRGNVGSLIRGNVVNDNGDDGLDVGMEASNVVIERNVVFNHVHPGGDGTGIKIGTHESYLKPTGGHIVRFNVVINSKLRNLDLAGNYRGTEKGLRPPPLIVYNNTLLDAGQDNVYLEMVDAVLLNNIATRSLNPAFWSCRLRVNDAMRDDPPVVVSDFNLWSNRWIKGPDGSMVTDQDSHSTDAAPEFTAWPAWSVGTDLSSPKFRKVNGLNLKPDSPGEGDGYRVEVFLAMLLVETPRPAWREILAPLAKRQIVDMGAR